MNKILKEIEHGGVKSLVRKALEKGILVKTLDCDPLVLCLEWKGRKLFMRKGVVPMEARMGRLTKDKEVTKSILKSIGIKTPKGITANNLTEAIRAIRKHKLKYPLIVKPIDDSLARGVTWDVRSRKDLARAIAKVYRNKSYKRKKKFLVEEMFEGEEYRVLVLNKKAVSCVRKIPASVIGDGRLTIKQLIRSFNNKRPKGYGIRIDKVVKATLKEKGLSINSVLPAGQVLQLRRNMNMSDGGRAIESMKNLHPYFVAICEKAVEVSGLSYAGVDLLVKDPSSFSQPYVVIEINSNPYYNMHEKPLVEGKSLDVSLLILKTLFPGLK